MRAVAVGIPHPRSVFFMLCTPSPSHPFLCHAHTGYPAPPCCDDSRPASEGRHGDFFFYTPQFLPLGQHRLLIGWDCEKPSLWVLNYGPSD